MLTQVRLQELLSSVPLFALDLPSGIATLVTLRDHDYETIWQLSNRIYDRYLSKQTAG